MSPRLEGARPPATPAAVGRRIAYFRYRAGMTGGELARRLHISEWAVRSYELRRRNTTPELLHRIATALRVNVLDLIGGW